MNIYNILAKIIIFPSKEYFLIPFIALLFHFYDKYVIARSAYLLLFTMVLAKFLKQTAGIILDLPLGECNLPSSHMLCGVVFWLYLAWESDKPIYKFLSFCYSIALGISIVYLGYHKVEDVVAAGLIAIVLVWIMRKIAYMNIFSSKEYYLPLFFIILSLPLIFSLKQSFPHLWITIGSLTGFAIGFYMREKSKIDQVYLGFEIPKPLIAISVIIGIASILGTVSLVGLIPFISKSFINFLKFVWITYWIVCGSDTYMQQLIEKIREQHRLKQEQQS